MEGDQGCLQHTEPRCMLLSRCWLHSLCQGLDCSKPTLNWSIPCLCMTTHADILENRFDCTAFYAQAGGWHEADKAALPPSAVSPQIHVSSSSQTFIIRWRNMKAHLEAPLTCSEIHSTVISNMPQPQISGNMFAGNVRVTSWVAII